MPQRGKPNGREPGASWSGTGLWLAPLLSLLIMLPPDTAGFPATAQRAAAVAVLMSVWWITESIPLAATALLPLVLFPLLGVMPMAQTAAPYANPIVFLFLGGFLLAAAMHKTALDRRVALTIVGWTGHEPDRLVLGFMIATAFLSMWISNTATAAMMVPIAVAIAQLLRPADADDFPFGTALLLGVAYAASIGGVGTLIGTPPNAVFAAAMREQLGIEVSFARWLLLGLPFVLLLIPVTWFMLTRVLFRSGALHADAHTLLARERVGLGSLRRDEQFTLVVFSIAALAWVFREPKAIASITVPGINSFAPGIDDAGIAIAAALALFLLPGSGRGTRVLEWADASHVPWGVLLLFGGGLSLARGFEESGLSQAIAGAVQVLGGAPVILLLLGIIALFCFLSELASNTAIAAMAMPLMAAAAVGVGQEPGLLMAAAAIAASCGFMLPVGTPPNAIAFGTGYVGLRQMLRAGLLLDLIAIAVGTLLVRFLGPILLR